MHDKLFVVGLSWQIDHDRLRATFALHGEVVNARVVPDPITGRSLGFGFVTMVDSDAAERAMAALNQQAIERRRIRIRPALERKRGELGEAIGGFAQCDERYCWMIFEDGSESLFDHVADPGRTTDLNEDYVFDDVREGLRSAALSRDGAKE